MLGSIFRVMWLLSLVLSDLLVTWALMCAISFSGFIFFVLLIHPEQFMAALQSFSFEATGFAIFVTRAIALVMMPVTFIVVLVKSKNVGALHRMLISRQLSASQGDA